MKARGTSSARFTDNYSKQAGERGGVKNSWRKAVVLTRCLPARAGISAEMGKGGVIKGTMDGWKFSSLTVDVCLAVAWSMTGLIDIFRWRSGWQRPKMQPTGGSWANARRDKLQPRILWTDVLWWQRLAVALYPRIPSEKIFLCLYCAALGCV